MIIYRLLSFIYPITRKFQSKHSGDLEIIYSNGKKILYSAKANYSYGALQRVLKFGLDQLNLNETKHLLILGLGGGSVIETLRIDFSFTHHITAVDIDPVMLDLADREFGIRNDEQTTLVCADAFVFLQNDTHPYDLIVVDLFIDDQIPPQFLRSEFWNLIVQHLSDNAALIFNTIDGQSLETIKSTLEKNGMGVRVYERVENTNTILIARTGGRLGLTY